MSGWTHHLIIAPILVPLVVAALLLFFDERQRVVKAMISLASTLILVVVSLALLRIESGPNDFDGVYLLGNWAAPSASCWFSTRCRR